MLVMQFGNVGNLSSQDLDTVSDACFLESDLDQGMPCVLRAQSFDLENDLSPYLVTFVWVT